MTEDILAAERERIATYIERYAAAVIAPAPKKDAVNNLRHSTEFNADFATLMRVLVTAIRGGLVTPENDWPLSLKDVR